MDVEEIEREQLATALSRLERRRDGDLTRRERDVVAELAASLVAAVAPAACRVVTVARDEDSSAPAPAHDGIGRIERGAPESSADRS